MQWLKTCYSRPLLQPRLSLICVFVAWKLLLLCAALLSPGPGYDTSTLHLIRAVPARPDSSAPASALVDLIASKFTRWDAFYYVTAASRGYVYEQERAFGWGVHVSIWAVNNLISVDGGSHAWLATTGVAISHLCHLLSILCIYELGRFASESGPDDKKVPFIAACLHLFAPAGIFLSAPYGESLYSFLSFAGAAVYAQSYRVASSRGKQAAPTWTGDALLLLSGVLFGLAPLMRSNGLFNGTIYAYDAVVFCLSLRKKRLGWAEVRHGICIGACGIMVGVGFAFPQYTAFREFCMAKSSDAYTRPPWCTDFPPSIYAYVQKAYWKVGFLRYWKPLNLPLFVIAAPMIVILQVSGYVALRRKLQLGRSADRANEKRPGKIINNNARQRPNGHSDSDSSVTEPSTAAPVAAAAAATDCFQRLALPQIILGTMALTNFHVQVITRLASGYPIPYIWLAARMLDRRKKYSRVITRWMVVYAIVQAGLYASFLPPA